MFIISHIIIRGTISCNKPFPKTDSRNFARKTRKEKFLDQYKEKKPKDPAIQKKFNTYQFCDHKEQVIALLGKVCTASVNTMKIVEDMVETNSVNDLMNTEEAQP